MTHKSVQTLLSRETVKATLVQFYARLARGMAIAILRLGAMVVEQAFGSIVYARHKIDEVIYGKEYRASFWD